MRLTTHDLPRTTHDRAERLMNEILTTSSPLAPRPLPPLPIATRLATAADLPFLDALQKQHSKALGFFPRAQMEGYVENGWVLIAEDAATKRPLGYCASRDRYLKRDELGVIYQLCVAQGHQRGLIGATLIRDVFARAAYGCRLYCCWCAQDLEANHFWESLGFVPVAFRAGGRGSGVGGRKNASRPATHHPRPTGPRVHIFWQRRIREDDATTPYWYPSKTDNGAMREDRLVFPIPPGVRWQDVRAIEVLVQGGLGILPEPNAVKKKSSDGTPRPRKAVAPPAPVTRRIVRRSGMLRFATAETAKIEPVKRERAPRAQVSKERAKVDPALLAQARELRDRWMERANERGVFGEGAGKYLVARTIDAPGPTPADAMLDAPRRVALPAA